MKLLKRFRGLVVLVVISGVLLGGLAAAKSVVLRRLQARLDGVVRYGDIRLTAFPPALVIEDVRSLSEAPYFAARRVTISLAYLSLLRRDKPLTVDVEAPVVRLSAADLRGSGGGSGGRLPALPFSLDRVLARNGDLSLMLPGGTVRLTNLRALLVPKSDRFDLRIAAGGTAYLPSPGEPYEGGRLELRVSGRGPELTIHTLSLEGGGAVLKAEGRFANTEPPVLEMTGLFNVDAALADEMFHLPLDWRGRLRGRGSYTAGGDPAGFEASLESRDLAMNDRSLGQVQASVRVAPGSGGSVTAELRKPGRPAEAVTVRFGGGPVTGEYRRFRLGPLMGALRVPWPISSPAGGTFRFEKGRLEAALDFRPEDAEAEAGMYPLAGAVTCGVVFATGRVDIRGEDLDLGFARLSHRTRLDIGTSVDAVLSGGVSDLKAGREFLALVLDETFDFPEIRGAGTMETRISGEWAHPRVEADFALSPGGFDRVDVRSAAGGIAVERGRFEGRFRVEDPLAAADLTVMVQDGAVDLDVRGADVETGMILPALRIPVALTGRARGDFRAELGGTRSRVAGTFTGRELRLLGRVWSDVEGALEWREGTIAFPRLRAGLEGGTLSGRAEIDLDERRYDIELEAAKFDLARLSPGFRGAVGGTLSGRGVFGREPLTGRFEGPDILIPPFQPVSIDGDIAFDLDDEGVRLELDGRVLPGDNPFSARLRWPSSAPVVEGEVRGSLSNLDLLLPWTGAKGRLNYLGRIQGPRSGPELSAAVDVAGPVLPFPGFAHALEDFSGLAVIQDGRVSIRSFQGSLGGGPVVVSGEVVPGAGGVRSLDLTAEAKDMLLSPLERTRAQADATLRLLKDDRRFILEGDVVVNRLLFRREIFEKFGFSSSAYYEPRADRGFFDDLTLNVRIRSGGEAWMENSLGRVNGRFDLTVSGGLNSPLLLGDIEAQGGEVFFQDRSFSVLKGRLNFFNPAALEPNLEFRGETYVKDYRVTLALDGPTGNLRPEFSSSPPLPPEDVLALLALGESFRRTYSYETSTTLSTASLLSFQIAEQAKKRAEGLFSLDRFRIDPFVMGTSAEMTARLTVGKKVSRNLLIMYSTNLTTQRDEIVRIEWELSNDFSLVGTRNEWGRISFDVKVRKRF